MSFLLIKFIITEKQMSIISVWSVEVEQLRGAEFHDGRL